MKTLATAMIATFVTALVQAAEPTAKIDEMVRPFPIVGIPIGASIAHKAAANELAQALGASVQIEAKANPACCVWLEITGWTPNPGAPGYIIVNQPGGSIVSASDEDQLKLAVQRFKNVMQKSGKDVLVPKGLLTNFPLAKFQSGS